MRKVGCHLLLINDRANHRIRVVWIAVFQALHVRSEAIDEFVVDFCIHDNAVGTHAALPLIYEATHRRRAYRVIDVRVVEYYARSVAAKFQNDALDPCAGYGKLTNPPAHACGACKGDQARGGMQREGVSNLLDRTDHDVQHTGRKTRLFINLGQQQTACHRRLLGGFHDYSVSQRQRGSNRPLRQNHRYIPSAYDADHTEWLLVRPALFAIFVNRKDLSLKTVRKRCSLDGDQIDPLPLQFGFQSGTTGLLDQPIDNLVAALFHDSAGP